MTNAASGYQRNGQDWILVATHEFNSRGRQAESDVGPDIYMISATRELGKTNLKDLKNALVYFPWFLSHSFDN